MRHPARTALAALVLAAATAHAPAAPAQDVNAPAAPARDANARDVAQSLSGRYSRHFTNGDIEGHAYGSDDVVEIVPVGQGAAYLRIELAFFNGHSCSLSGVATARDQGLVYESSEFAMPGAPPCTLTVSRRDASLRIDDDGGRCKAYCGERGSLSNATLPLASRRPIGYLARLKSSQEFTDALKAWQQRPVPAETRKAP